MTTTSSTASYSQLLQADYQEKNEIGIVEYKHSIVAFVAGAFVEVRCCSSERRCWRSIEEWMAEIDWECGPPPPTTTPRDTLNYNGVSATIQTLIEMRRGDLRQGDFPPDKPARRWTGLAEWKDVVDRETASQNETVEVAGLFLLYKGSKVMAKNVTDSTGKKWECLQDWIRSVELPAISEQLKDASPASYAPVCTSAPAPSVLVPLRSSQSAPLSAISEQLPATKELPATEQQHQEPQQITQGTKYRLGSLSTTVGLKDGTLLELRRGAHTWPSFKETQKTWGSFKEWREAVGLLTEEMVEETKEGKEGKEGKEKGPKTPKQKRPFFHPDLKRLLPPEVLDQEMFTYHTRGNLVKVPPKETRIRSVIRKYDCYIQNASKRIEELRWRKEDGEALLKNHEANKQWEIERIRKEPERKFKPNRSSRLNKYAFINREGNLCYIWFNARARVFATSTDPTTPLDLDLFGGSLEEIGVGPDTKIWKADPWHDIGYLKPVSLV